MTRSTLGACSDDDDLCTFELLEKENTGGKLELCDTSFSPTLLKRGAEFVKEKAGAELEAAATSLFPNEKVGGTEETTSLLVATETEEFKADVSFAAKIVEVAPVVRDVDELKKEKLVVALGAEAGALNKEGAL